MDDNKKALEIQQHYVRLITDTSLNVLNKVLPKNDLAAMPTKAEQLRPVPVYEEDAYSLFTVVNERCPTTIEWPAIPSYTYVPAYYKRYRDADKKPYNKIVVMAENYCHARFFAAKELMHCFLDDDHISATNSFDLVNSLIDELAAGNNAMSFTPQTVVDEAAWFGAALYLIPNGWIPLLKKMHATICEAAPNSAQQAFFHIAHEIRVPEVVLRARMKSHAP